ncbi:MAG: trypsin-like peptidase domain-containing protein [Clostridia bacterium]|nr:trypsin-like peptidase domain-containing protein [Clostridia bacterium]
MKRTTALLLSVLLLLAALPAAALTGAFSADPDAIEETAQSVFLIRAYDKNGEPDSSGSGFLMFGGDILVTNHHVVNGAYSLTAESDDGKVYPLEQLLIASRENDLAILRFGEPVGKPLEPSEEKLRRGENVTAFGSPQGLKNTVSKGNVSHVDPDEIRFTAPISGGSSGGVLIGENGKAVGVVYATLKAQSQNVNFAKPIALATELYAQWDGKSVYAVPDLRLARVDGSKPVYETTAAFLRELDSRGTACTFDGLDEKGTERVYIENRNDQGYKYVIRCAFSEEGRSLRIFVWNAVDFNAKDLGKAIRFVNDLNAKYKWARFSVDRSDNSVTCDTDLVLPEDGTAGEIAYTGLVHLAQVLNSAYEVLGTIAK